MLGRLLLWARRHSREAVALALAPGLVALAFDAAIAHWAGKDFDNRLQAVPVVYGLVGFVLMTLVCIPSSRALFAWTARLVGGAGVVIGLVGTVVHLRALLEELQGQYTAASLEGGFSVAPPLLAPLGFAGVGAVLFLLPSARLLLRLRVGNPPTASTAPAEVIQLPQDQRRAG